MQVEYAKSRELAVMHNDLIRASYDMTVNEMRLLMVILAQLPKRDEDNLVDPSQPIYVTKESFVQLGVESKNVVREIRTACQLLRKKEFKVPTPLGELVYPLFDSMLNVKDTVYQQLKTKYPNAQYDDEFMFELRKHNLLDVLDKIMNSDANIIVHIVMHPKVLPYLVDLKQHFTKLYLDEFFTFSSSYSWRIYFIMMQFRNDNEKWWCRIKLDDLRKALMLEDKYTLMADFKKRVIESAVDEINEKSPIKVKYDLERSGRKYTHLVLNFELKDNKKAKKSKHKKIIFASDKQRLMFADKLSKLNELSHRATGEAGRSYEAFAEKIAIELLDSSNHEFYRPYLDKVGFKQ